MVKNAAVAINPLDWAKQDLGALLFSWIKYPFVLGSDVAGEVLEVGVNRFRVGERVFGHCAGMDKAYNTSSQSGFQVYTILFAHGFTNSWLAILRKRCGHPLGRFYSGVRAFPKGSTCTTTAFLR